MKMATDHYKKNIQDIEDYYGVSHVCAKYIYHRAIRGKRKKDDPTYLDWNIQLQNALVKADKCLGIEWDKMFFGKEEESLLGHGLILDEMETTTFRWCDLENLDTDEKPEIDKSDTDAEQGWTKIIRKPHKLKKKKNHKFNFVLAGLYV